MHVRVQEFVVYVCSLCIIIKCSYAIYINGCYFCHRTRSHQTEACREV